MKVIVEIPAGLWETVNGHLFQGNMEEAAFLFAEVNEEDEELRLHVKDIYLIPPRGWTIQTSYHLEMVDSERATIMKIARDNDYAIIDCHSHPFSADGVWFSWSDRRGIAEFADYAKWKLPGKPFVALVLGSASIDGVGWHGGFTEATPIAEIMIKGKSAEVLHTRGTWFKNIWKFWNEEYE